jgi:hypothetical protein
VRLTCASTHSTPRSFSRIRFALRSSPGELEFQNDGVTEESYAARF